MRDALRDSLRSSSSSCLEGFNFHKAPQPEYWCALARSLGDSGLLGSLGAALRVWTPTQHFEGSPLPLARADVRLGSRLCRHLGAFALVLVLESKA